MSSPGVGITGMGLVSPAGPGVEALWSAVREGRTVIAGDGLGRISAIERADPLALARQAIAEAIAQAGWDSAHPLGEADGLIVATTVGQISRWESEMLACLRGEAPMAEFARFAASQPIGSLLEEIARSLGFHGRTCLIASACSAGTQAIALGAMWVRAGEARRCLVGGVEVLSELTVQGFRSLGLLSTEPARPFDRDRRGINLSEAAAFICLERAPVRELARVSGEGFATDAFHLASPEPAGRGSLAAMSQALARAGLTADDISWVHAHGTGSLANDLAEGAAIATLLGDRARPVVSTKGVHGHALGASGVLEAILCVRSIADGVIPVTTGLAHPDPAIALRHPARAATGEVRHVLKNTLGFGGNNAAIVLSEARSR